MRNITLVLLFIGLASYVTLNSKTIPTIEKQKSKTINPKNDLSPNQLLYNDLKLNNVLNYSIFDLAINGYNHLKHNINNKDIITIIDFSLPSTEKRMFVIDLKNKEILYHNIVSHGQKSGLLYATDFSNRHGSHQSSLGFYVTKNTYQGSNGYSLVIDGLEEGINDQAKARAVVIHGADYCSEDIIKKTGRLGRSYGCPALPRKLNTPIINTIKNGSLLFIYADDKEYLTSSEIIKHPGRTMIAQHEDINNTENGVL